MAIVTKQSLIKLLSNPNPEFRKQVIGRALVVLYNNQTEQEKNEFTTINNNGVGFCGYDSKVGTLDAKYFLKTGTLFDFHVNRWLKPNKNGVPRIAKYVRQLDAAAQIKKAKETYKLT